MSCREVLGSSWERRLREGILARAVERDPGPPLDRAPMLLEMHGLKLPEPHLVERVRLGGLLSLVWATVWCRQNAPAHAGSPVPWDPTALQPWVVELHGWWPDRDRPEGPRLGVALSVPCPTDPRIPGVEADAAIRWVIARALMHEAQEGTWLDGEHLDPHAVGEIGLKDVWSALAVDALTRGEAKR